MFSKRQEARISKLLVYCANKAHGCESTLKVIEYQYHLSVDNALNYPTRFNVVLTYFVVTHCRAKCPKRRVQCQYCKSKGEYQIITGDHRDTCPCYPLTCLQACGAEVLRKDLTAHQGVCPLEPVACPSVILAARVKVPRRDHIQSSMFQHMTDTALSHTATKTQLTALKQEHEALNKDHIALKEDHTALKKDYTTLKESNIAKMNTTG